MILPGRENQQQKPKKGTERMPKYTVQVVYHMVHDVEVEADNDVDAARKAEDYCVKHYGHGELKAEKVERKD